MDSNSAESSRDTLLKDGYCVVDGRLPPGTLEELRDWSNHWISHTEHVPQWKYQGSDIKITGIRNRRDRDRNMPSDSTVDFLIEHPRRILQELGLGDFRSGGHFQIISKPPSGPPLYWHQDWARWDDPISMAPWPQQIFLNWYLTDTTVENGCLRVIPGSHLKRLDLHSHLIKPHEGGGYLVDETNKWMFHDHPNAIDVLIHAGDLLIADARVLHGTHANHSEERRSVLLGWFFRKNHDVPSYWMDDVPPEVLNRDPDTPFVFNRQPGKYLR